VGQVDVLLQSNQREGCPHRNPNRARDDVTHDAAITDIAPEYYSRVRLHRVLCNFTGSRDQAFFRIQRTTSVQYEPIASKKGNSVLTHRDVVNWDGDDNEFENFYEMQPQWSLSIHFPDIHLRFPNIFEASQHLRTNSIRDACINCPFPLLTSSGRNISCNSNGFQQLAFYLQLISSIELARICRHVAKKILIPNTMSRTMVSLQVKAFQNCDCDSSEDFFRKYEDIFESADYILSIIILSNSSESLDGDAILTEASLSHLQKFSNRDFVLHIPFSCRLDAAKRCKYYLTQVRHLDDRSLKKLLFQDIVNLACWNAQHLLALWLRKARLQLSNALQSYPNEAIARECIEMSDKVIVLADCRERLLMLLKLPSNGESTQVLSELKHCITPAVEFFELERMRSGCSLEYEHSPNYVINHIQDTFSFDFK